MYFDFLLRHYVSCKQKYFSPNIQFFAQILLKQKVGRPTEGLSRGLKSDLVTRTFPEPTQPRKCHFSYFTRKHVLIETKKAQLEFSKLRSWVRSPSEESVVTFRHSRHLRLVAMTILLKFLFEVEPRKSLRTIIRHILPPLSHKPLF